jgi:hypothetical protein
VADGLAAGELAAAVGLGAGVAAVCGSLLEQAATATRVAAAARAGSSRRVLVRVLVISKTPGCGIGLLSPVI